MCKSGGIKPDKSTFPNEEYNHKKGDPEKGTQAY
jgi:hypothetical protein